MPVPVNPNRGNLDSTQILQRAFDELTDRLRTDATVTIDQINVEASVEIDAADGDNIAIANADGSKKVTVTTIGAQNGLDVNIINDTPIEVTTTSVGVVKSFYNEITSVPAATLTTISTYTVPVGKTGFLQKCCFSGTSIASYTLLLNGNVIDKKYTVFGSSFNDEFLFCQEVNNGLPITAGDVIQVKVIHARPTVNDFNNRIQVVEI